MITSRFLSADVVLQAVDWWERAAGEALERGAQLEALRLLGRAAGLADSLHDNEQETDKVRAATQCMLPG